MGRQNVAVEASIEKSSKKKSKNKRTTPEIDTPIFDDLLIEKKEETNGTQIDDDEPTMEDRLASLDLLKKDDTEMQEMPKSQELLPPSADSVHVLLKQALHADDRALLLECLYNQNDKVITKSVSLLSAADIFKLLNSLLSIIQSRGAVLVCALPWLRSLLLQHSSRIISQEISLKALNSIYQLIESRVATFSPAQQLASSLDLMFVGAEEEVVNEQESIAPAIYNDDSDVEEASEEDAMDTNDETEQPEDASVVSDALSDEDFSD